MISPRRFVRPYRFVLAALLGSLLHAPAAHGQAMPTASRGVIITGFGMASGTWTGLSGGRNLGITAGVDIGLRSFFGLRPEGEFRATYPINSGTFVGLKSFMGGIKLGPDSIFGLHPYANFL